MENGCDADAEAGHEPSGGRYTTPEPLSTIERRIHRTLGPDEAQSMGREPRGLTEQPEADTKAVLEECVPMRIREARVAVVAGLGALTLASLAATGCGGRRVDAYRLNPTPNVHTLSETGDEIANKTTATFDTNFRMLNEDLGRFLFLDRPSRLSPKPIPR